METGRHRVSLSEVQAESWHTPVCWGGGKKKKTVGRTLTFVSENLCRGRLVCSAMAGHGACVTTELAAMVTAKLQEVMEPLWRVD